VFITAGPSTKRKERGEEFSRERRERKERLRGDRWEEEEIGKWRGRNGAC
jgi:hypothetical protein